MDELGDKAAARSQSALMAVTLRNASGCAGNVGVRSQSALMAVTLRNYEVSLRGNQLVVSIRAHGGDTAQR